ncbi:MAG: hypothetical protein IKP96_00880 [Elusimicrobiaceae bacterium]|nr:hypothetical protein [Elusimicrobiaceae bacterium]
MPEGKKKDSFTFSDKIKTSKQTAPKSFANRISSKIGLDGKPRQTLFERAKRDTPFFIAAIVALLLLPFLYKYSGQVSEDASVITPGYEDAIVNPDRSGFDLTGENTEGQIAQLSGRDSMDLIVGFGKHREEESEDSLSDLYRSGLSEDKAASYTRSDMDEEINNTNIYKYRKKAPVQTRAAFRRAATTIGRLGQAGLSGRGGGRAIAPWGGSLKTASKRMRPQGPRNSTKPVSLQKLTPAGKPSRSSFGQGAAAEARRSKDAMSKGNAMQALMDAQMKPVEPGRIGGILGGDFGGPGGGNGNLQRQFAFNGKEPWWWDLMKTRSQMEWEKKFNYKWGWIDFGTKLLQNLLDPFLSCFFTGTDDWSMGKMFGAVAGAGDDPKCGELTEEDWKNCDACLKHGKFGKRPCKSYLATLDPNSSMVKKGWQGSNKAEANMTWWQSRRNCWTEGISAYVSGKLSLDETSDCNNLAAGYYQVNPSGAARKWNTYIYVVARNYMPEASKVYLDKKAPRGFLCTDDSDKLKIGHVNSSGVGATGLNEKFDGKKSGTERTEHEASLQKRHGGDEKLTEDIYDRDAETVQNGCVIYLQKGDTFNYKNFETSMIARFKELLKKQGSTGDLEVEARNAFLQLDLMFVESFSAKDKIGLASHTVDLPMTYWRFRDAYIRHKRTQTANDETFAFNRNVDNRKYRIEGADYIMGDRCPWNNALGLACVDYPQDIMFDNIDGIDEFKFPTAYVAFKRGYHGLDNPTASNGGTWKNGKTSVSRALEEIQVTAEFIPLKKGEIGNVEQHTVDPLAVKGEPALVQYQFKHVVNADKSNRVDFPKDLPGEVIWRLYRSGKLLETRTCDVNSAADDQGVSPTVEEKEPCEKGPDTSQECCEEVYAKNDPKNEYKWINEKCQITPKQQRRQEGVAPLEGPSTDCVALASGLNFVPRDPEGGRKPFDCNRTPVQSDFKESLVSQYKPKALKEPAMPAQSCEEVVGLIMDSNAAKQFVEDVRVKYNNKHQGAPQLKEIGKFPTDGEFVDALNLAQTLGITKVPAAAVCELGRDIVRLSRDPHTAKAKTYTKKHASPYDEEFVGKTDEFFHNDLGAFLIYVSPSAMLYPAKYIVQDGECDMRFMPVQSGECYPLSGLPGKFHFNNYGTFMLTGAYGTWEHPRGFAASLTERGLDKLNTNPPLQALADDKISTKEFPVKDCGKELNCSKRGNAYRKQLSTFLTEGSGFKAGEGNACVAFYGGDGPDIKVADVLEYIQMVCTAGLNFKPNGVGSDKPGGGANKPLPRGSGSNGVTPTTPK